LGVKVSKNEEFNAIAAEVKANGGVQAVRMERLRNAAGYGKLGKYVVQEIGGELRRRGLGTCPDPLPSSDAWSTVMLYELGSTVERLVHAVREPSEEGVVNIRELANQNPNEILDQVRALVERPEVA
jgi:hypothetical protein